MQEGLKIWGVSSNVVDTLFEIGVTESPKSRHTWLLQAWDVSNYLCQRNNFLVASKCFKRIQSNPTRRKITFRVNLEPIKVSYFYFVQVLID